MFKAKIYYSPKANPEEPYCLHIIHTDKDGNEDNVFPPVMHSYDNLDDAMYVPMLFHYPVETVRC